jgi:hypothetical protein
MSIDMFKLSGYTSDKAISVEMLAPIKYTKSQRQAVICHKIAALTYLLAKL